MATKSLDYQYIRRLGVADINTLTISTLEEFAATVKDRIHDILRGALAGATSERKEFIEVQDVYSMLSNAIKNSRDFQTRFTNYVMEAQLEGRNPFQRDAIVHYVRRHPDDFSIEVRKKVELFRLHEKFRKEEEESKQSKRQRTEKEEETTEKKI